MTRFVDTHTHIHFADYGLDAEEVWNASKQSGVNRIIAVGCRLEDSEGAVAFARDHQGVWASVGIHPHEAREFLCNPESKSKLRQLLVNAQKDKVVAVGEVGLDYHYEHSDKHEQKEILEYQLGLAQEYGLPVILHIRDAFNDFWPIFDQYEGLKGVVHSFSSTPKHLDEVLSRGLYVGLNGIITFTKEPSQLEAAKQVPLDRLLLETDAPYLTPKPYRGKICKPEYVKLVAQFLAELREESIEVIGDSSTANAIKIFGIE